MATLEAASLDLRQQIWGRMSSFHRNFDLARGLHSRPRAKYTRDIAAGPSTSGRATEVDLSDSLPPASPNASVLSSRKSISSDHPEDCQRRGSAFVCKTDSDSEASASRRSSQSSLHSIAEVSSEGKNRITEQIVKKVHGESWSIYQLGATQAEQRNDAFPEHSLTGWWSIPGHPFSCAAQPARTHDEGKVGSIDSGSRSPQLLSSLDRVKVKEAGWVEIRAASRPPTLRAGEKRVKNCGAECGPGKLGSRCCPDTQSSPAHQVSDLHHRLAREASLDSFMELDRSEDTLFEVFNTEAEDAPRAEEASRPDSPTIPLR